MTLFLQVIETLDFNPIFYILDHDRCRVMVVKREDKYEYSGLWVDVRDGLLGVFPATLGKSHIAEYNTNYDFSLNKEEAAKFLDAAVFRTPLTTEEMQLRNSNPDFIY